MHVLKQEVCRVCECDLFPAISLGDQFLQGSFSKPGMPEPSRKVPMNLVRCDPMKQSGACGLLQTEYTVPPELMYETYWYRSGTNATMRQHLSRVADEALLCLIDNGVNVRKRNFRVLDIGCNDGTLLNIFKEKTDAALLVGVDPSNIAAEYARKLKVDIGADDDVGPHIINDFYPSPQLDMLLNSKLPEVTPVEDSGFNIITAIAMIYDLQDPVDFFDAVATNLAIDGVFVFEMSHMPTMLENLSYDTICHEHLEYYSLATIEWALRRANLKVISIGVNDINGGSICGHAVHMSNPISTAFSVKNMRRKEFDLKLDTNEPYVSFSKRADVHKEELQKLLRSIKSKGERVHVYGASTKGNTILQWCGITPELIEYAADRNADKWGATTPGTKIKIISEEESRSMKPDYYLVLPWHFREEFLDREKGLLSTGTKMIFPLPKIQVIGRDLSSKGSVQLIPFPTP